MDLKYKQSTLVELLKVWYFLIKVKKLKFLPQEMPQNFQTLPEYFETHPENLIALPENIETIYFLFVLIK